MGIAPSKITKRNDYNLMNASSYSRRAYHAGSWYSSDGDSLDKTLSEYLNEAASWQSTEQQQQQQQKQPLRAIICPHAGYSYSGPTAAFSYLHLQQELSKKTTPITTILILHPSHHVYLDGIAVSGATQIETPCGNLQIDNDIRQEILSVGSGKVSIMSQRDDEREHSGEMQYPFIAKACGNNDTIKVLPIMCGSISNRTEEFYGKLLADFVARPTVLCVISTDFCHWGSRFQFQPTPSVSSQQIFEYIQQLDHRGMSHIELQDPGAFAKYLKETRNTICGRHAISVWMQAIHANTNDPNKNEALEVTFVKYDQSSPATSLRDSSVSYASATARLIS